MPTIFKLCLSCGTRWFFDEDHQQRPDVDLDTCSWCGGRLGPSAERRPLRDDEG